MSKILVTGSSGVIGRELLPLINQKGNMILAVDRVKPETKLPDVVYLQRNIGTDTTPEIEAFDPDTVFHLAASFERTQETADFFEPNFDDNIRCSHYIISHTKPKKFVFASSYLVYERPLKYISGWGDLYAFSEIDPVNPRNLVAMSKLYTEKELEFKQHFNPSMKVINARIFRSYGKGSRDIISRWIRAFLRNEKVDVWGQHNIFDYIYAGDVAFGLMMLSELNTSVTVNLGSGEATAISDVFSIVNNSATPNKSILNIHPSGPIDEKSVSANYMLKELLNWKPPTTVFEGVQKIIKYEREKMGE